MIGFFIEETVTSTHPRHRWLHTFSWLKFCLFLLKMVRWPCDRSFKLYGFSLILKILSKADEAYFNFLLVLLEEFIVSVSVFRIVSLEKKNIFFIEEGVTFLALIFILFIFNAERLIKIFFFQTVQWLNLTPLNIIILFLSFRHYRYLRFQFRLLQRWHKFLLRKLRTI